MKKATVLFSSILFGFLLAGCNETILDFRNAEISNGRIYQVQNNTPFSGLVTNMPEEDLVFPKIFPELFRGFSLAMQRLKHQENSLVGQHLICNVEVDEGYVSGTTTCFQPNSNIKRYVAHHKGGNLDGDLVIFATDGVTILLKSIFKNDKINGITEIFSPNNGALVIRNNSENDLLDGLSERWDEHTGNLIYRAKAINGQYVGVEETWTAGGVKTSETPYENGKVNGVARLWNERTGKLIKEVTFVDNIRNGPAKSWNEDGTLESSGTYNMGSYYPDK